jgi:hypothetical protein
VNEGKRTVDKKRVFRFVINIPKVLNYKANYLFFVLFVFVF